MQEPLQRAKDYVVHGNGNEQKPNKKPRKSNLRQEEKGCQYPKMKAQRRGRTNGKAAPGEMKVGDAPAISENFPGAQAVLNAQFEVLDSNREFRVILSLPLEKAKLDRTFPELFGERGESVKKYLAISNETGLLLEYKAGEKSATRHLRLLSRILPGGDEREPESRPNDSATYYCVALQDLTNFQESVAYFEQSFDQFMEATIDLEEALRTIARQKNEIESMNHELSRANVIMRKDLELAEIVQKDLMPATPKPEGWQLSTYFQPMAGVSGDILDYYDFPGADNQGVVLLDASGHGVSSALITAIARPIFFRAQRRYVNQDLSVAVSSANRMLCDQIGHISNYLTGVSVRLYPDRFTYINAGHPYILIYRRRLGRVFRLPNSAVLLGIDAFRERTMVGRTVGIEPGDILLLYTDGLTEANNEEGQEYGLQRLRDTITAAAPLNDADQMRDFLLDDFRSFAATPDRLKDDMTFVVIYRL